MISPSIRAVRLAGALALPLCTLGALVPRLSPFCVITLLVLAALAIVDAYFGVRNAWALQVNAPASVKWFKDREATLTLQVERDSNRALLVDLALELPESIRSGSDFYTLLIHQQAACDVHCTPTLRGQFRITSCHLRTRSRFGLWQLRSAKPLAISVQVYPDLEREPGSKLLLRRKTVGPRTQRLIGRGREFERLRDYAHGDSFDEIYWKATARHGKPVVKVFQVEQSQDVYVAVDTSRLGLRNGAVDHFVNAALMTALAAENHGDRFGLVTFSDRVDRFVPAARGRSHFSRCRDALYAVQPRLVSPDFEELFTFLQLRIRKRALLFFLTDVSDPLLAESFSRGVHILSRRHLVLVGRLDDPEQRALFTGPEPQTLDEIHSRLAGHLNWAKVHEVEQDLRRHGLHIAALRPGSAGLDLVTQYITLKQRQIL